MHSYTSRRVLVIETDEDDRTLIRAFLASSDYEIYCYPIKGTETYIDEIFAIYETWQPEILLLDSSIPNFDVCELVSRLKSDASYRHIPILILSSLENKETCPTEIKLGLVLPVSKNEICLVEIFVPKPKSN